jgi:hypothetical protein
MVFRRSLATWRVLALATVPAVVAVVVAASPGIAAASSAPHRQLRPGAPAMPGAGLALAQAPAGLRAAVHRTLRIPAVSAGGALRPAELTVSGGAAGDESGFSVAVSGSTAVVGAPYRNSNTGAAYVFVRSGGAWAQQAMLTVTGGAPGDEFGYSVAVSGSAAVVGAWGTGNHAGAAYVFTRSGGTWSRQATLTDPGGATYDGFGHSVALSGSTAVIGAYGTNGFTGAAYVFTGSGGTWSQRAELTASGGGSGDAFGSSVALSGFTMVVGTPGANNFTGSAYVFVGSGGTWSQQAELTDPGGAASASFGSSVAVSGSRAVIGAPGANNFTGSAYVFVGSGGTWSQQAELTDPGGTPGDAFGFSVALSKSTAVVGAPAVNSAGAAYVFTASGGTWSRQAELTDPGGGSGDEFGYSVAVSGSTAVAGVPGTNSFTGTAYAFALPSQQAELTAPHHAAHDGFGYSVAVSGSTAVVGAYAKNSGTGAAYVFVRSGSTWSQQAELSDPGGAADDGFGSSVALSGSTAVVGTPGQNSATGAAYVYVRTGSIWSRQAELTTPGDAPGDDFGASVAISGSTAVAGAPGTTSGTGAAYVFTRSAGTWSRQATLTSPGTAPGDIFGTAVAISGSTAVVGAYGTNSYTGMAYIFTRSAGTWSQQATLADPGAAAHDFFGYSVAISGSTAVVGAYGTSAATGTAYIFARSGGTWSQQATLTDPGGVPGDCFGYSVTLSATTAVVGAPGTGSLAGAAYMFTGSTWSRQATLTAPNGAANEQFGASVALAKSTAVVGTPGKSSLTGAAYVFVNM